MTEEELLKSVPVDYFEWARDVADAIATAVVRANVVEPSYEYKSAIFAQWKNDRGVVNLYTDVVDDMRAHLSVRSPPDAAEWYINVDLTTKVGSWALSGILLDAFMEKAND